MNKVGVLFILILILIALPVKAQSDNNSSDLSEIEKAYQCLESGLEAKSSDSLVLSEAIFGILALGSDTKLETKIADQEKENCWPKPTCSLKETSQVLLAYDRINKNINEIESYLVSKNASATDLTWSLIIDISNQVPSTCQVSYSSSSHTIQINEDMKISGSPGNCFSISQSGYWLEVQNSCLDTEFQISCDQDFVTSINYKKQNSDTLFVSPTTHSAPSSGTTTEKIDAKCFKTGSQCDYEGSLWTTLALQKAGYDVSPFIPYLVALAEDNQNTFPSSFLYLITSSDEQYSKIAQSQISNQFWSSPGSNYNKFYDTALALLSLQGTSALEADNSKDYLIQIQDPNTGCWNNNNLRDTGFLLYAGWPGQVVTQQNGNNSIEEPGTSLSCASQGYFCSSFLGCSDAGGETLQYDCPSFGDVCCSVSSGSQESCFVKGGKICPLGESCSGNVVSSLDGSCCLGTCQPTNSGASQCDIQGGICYGSCSSNEEQISASCSNPSEVCCITSQTGSSGGNSNLVIWIILLIFLIALIGLGIVFRKKLQMLIFKFRNKKSGQPSRTNTRRPPFPPTAPRGRFSPQVQRPVGSSQPRYTRQPSRTDKEMEETLKKLREMSK